MVGPSPEVIADLLGSAETRARTDLPETLDQIRAGFGEAFEKVKDRLGDSWEDVQALYRMSFDDGFEVKKEVRYATIGALAYLVSPIDLLPERVLGSLGLADDVAVLLFALKYAQPEIERYRNYRAEVAEGDTGTGGGGGIPA